MVRVLQKICSYYCRARAKNGGEGMREGEGNSRTKRIFNHSFPFEFTFNSNFPRRAFLSFPFPPFGSREHKEKLLGEESRTPFLPLLLCSSPSLCRWRCSILHARMTSDVFTANKGQREGRPLSITCEQIVRFHQFRPFIDRSGAEIEMQPRIRNSFAGGNACEAEQKCKH